MEETSKNAAKLADAHMPIGIRYFTSKDEADRIEREASQRKLGQSEASAATQKPLANLPKPLESKRERNAAAVITCTLMIPWYYTSS